MKLRLKFNLMMLLALLLALLGSGWFSYNLLQNNARQAVLKEAGLLMDTALAIRAYTVEQVRPHLADKLSQTFLPQSVPAYAATETLQALQEQYQLYSYKEATLNPTNPRDRAQGWEWELVNKFRNNPQQQEIIGERNYNQRQSILYMARPIQIKNAGCLTCHSDPSAAPSSMIELYGPHNGFGWQMDEVIGAQIVTVPLSVPINNANRAFFTFMGSLLVVFLVIFIVLNLMLHSLIIKPIVNISASADKISTGDFNIAEFPENKNDEIGVLAKSFNRMRRSLNKAMQMTAS